MTITMTNDIRGWMGPMGSSLGDVSEEPDVGEAKEGLEDEL